jgi:polyhydroxybutyrate depolymerase
MTDGSSGASGAIGTAGNAGADVGAGGMSTGSGGMTTAGAGGAAGASMAGSGGMSGGGTITPPPKGNSMGCTKAPPAGDSATAWVEHDIMVTEPLSQDAIKADPAKGGTYDWTHRNYFLRLPKNYDPSKPYRLEIGGSGCGGSDTVGAEGGYAIQDAGETNAVQVALSYLASASEGACFADDFVDPPDLEYFDAVLADLETNFCIDKANVYMHGYSSGAWETYMLGCARAGIIRGIFTSQGGERLKRPACTGPIAALLSAGADASNDNPIGPLDPSSATAKSLDSLGSAVARDDILMRNGCTSTLTKTWSGASVCQQYVDCPAAYPVIWCPINGGHDYASSLAAAAEMLFQGLPAAP